MNELMPYICPQCGGKVNRLTLTCEMCGTQFRETSPMKIEITKPGVHVLQTHKVIDDTMISAIGLKETSEIVMKQLAHEFADCIAPFIDVRTWQDPQHFQTHVAARIRVLDPQQRF